MRAASTPRALVLSLLVATVAVTGVVAVQAVTAPPAVAAAAPPDASNTGVPAGTVLQRINGSVVLNRAGATYRNLDIRGRVRIDAPNITLVNSIVHGDAQRVQGAIIDCNYGGASHNGFVLRDSTIWADAPSVYQVGIMGHDFSVIRSEITRVVDGVDVVGGNVTVQRSWIHDTSYVSAAASPTGRDTHNDGVQVMSGANISIVGNTISGNHNAALMVAQDQGATSGVRFVGNWSNGGGCTVNVSPTPRTSIAGLYIQNNRFKHNTSVANCAIVLNRGVSMATSGNVWQDTGGAVALTRGA